MTCYNNRLQQHPSLEASFIVFSSISFSSSRDIFIISTSQSCYLATQFCCPFNVYCVRHVRVAVAENNFRSIYLSLETALSAKKKSSIVLNAVVRYVPLALSSLQS